MDGKKTERQKPKLTNAKTLWLAQAIAAILLVSCAQAKHDVDVIASGGLAYELGQAAGDIDEFWALWEVYQQGGEISVIDRDGLEGFACVWPETLEILVKRPVGEVVLLEPGDECPFLMGDFDVEE